VTVGRLSDVLHAPDLSPALGINSEAEVSLPLKNAPAR
jgi:hypothetical protein